RKREKVHPTLDFLLFMAFFPKLIAGPILRAKEFLPQLGREWKLTAVDARGAVKQILVGLALKLLLADKLGVHVDAVFKAPTQTLTSLDVWVATIAFGLQIYFDFSAYTRLAIGSAKLCGIDLVENFDHPYISRSPPEFWRRW